MATVQMNVRLDADIKAAGDEAFASIGCTPTQVVQRIWGFAAQNRTNKRAIHSAVWLDRGTRPVDGPETQTWAQQGVDIYFDALEQLGVEEARSLEPAAIDYEKLRYDAYRERYPDLLSPRSEEE